MKSKVTFYLIKEQVPKMEYDDGPFNTTVEEVTVDYKHFFVNKRRRMIKAMVWRAMLDAEWGVMVCASFEKERKCPGILDRGFACINGKRYDQYNMRIFYE